MAVHTFQIFKGLLVLTKMVVGNFSLRKTMDIVLFVTLYGGEPFIEMLLISFVHPGHKAQWNIVNWTKGDVERWSLRLSAMVLCCRRPYTYLSDTCMKYVLSETKKGSISKTKFTSLWSQDVKHYLPLLLYTMRGINISYFISYYHCREEKEWKSSILSQPRIYASSFHFLTCM